MFRRHEKHLRSFKWRQDIRGSHILTPVLFIARHKYYLCVLLPFARAQTMGLSSGRMTMSAYGWFTCTLVTAGTLMQQTVTSVPAPNESRCATLRPYSRSIKPEKALSLQIKVFNLGHNKSFCNLYMYRDPYLVRTIIHIEKKRVDEMPGHRFQYE